MDDPLKAPEAAPAGPPEASAIVGGLKDTLGLGRPTARTPVDVLLRPEGGLERATQAAVAVPAAGLAAAAAPPALGAGLAALGARLAARDARVMGRIPQGTMDPARARELAALRARLDAFTRRVAEESNLVKRADAAQRDLRAPREAMVNTLNRVGPPPTARSVATQAAIPTATALAGRYGEAPPEDEGALPDELREIFDAYDALRRAQGGQ